MKVYDLCLDTILVGRIWKIVLGLNFRLLAEQRLTLVMEMICPLHKIGIPRPPNDISGCIVSMQSALGPCVVAEKDLAISRLGVSSTDKNE